MANRSVTEIPTGDQTLELREHGDVVVPERFREIRVHDVRLGPTFKTVVNVLAKSHVTGHGRVAGTTATRTEYKRGGRVSKTSDSNVFESQARGEDSGCSRPS